MFQIPEFTENDFLNTTKPFEFIRDNAKDPLREEQLLQQVECIAMRRGVRHLRRMYEFFRQTEQNTTG